MGTDRIIDKEKSENLGDKIMSKEALRSVMKAKRKALSSDERTQMSERIFMELTKVREYKNAKSVCVYMNCFGEVKTDLIISDCRKKGKRILFPVSDVKTHTLSLCLDTGEFIKGAYGILEPYPKKTVYLDEVDMVIVPGLAFDEEKNRLGFGAGYYDRFLEECRAFKVGICYDFQVLEKIEAKAHDVKMDILITNERIIN